MRDQLTETSSLRMQAASRACQAAVARAEQEGIAIAAAVVDAAGHRLCVMRMENAFFHAAGIAEDKAYTAASFGFSTSDWDQVVAGNQKLADGLNARPRLVMFGGGIPITVDGKLVGAIGVSGGSEEQDSSCARAGLQAL